MKILTNTIRCSEPFPIQHHLSRKLHSLIFADVFDHAFGSVFSSYNREIIDIFIRIIRCVSVLRTDNQR